MAGKNQRLAYERYVLVFTTLLFFSKQKVIPIVCVLLLLFFPIYAVTFETGGAFPLCSTVGCSLADVLVLYIPRDVSVKPLR